MLKRERTLLPRPRFYSRSPDAKGISPEHAEFILRHIVQQRHQELLQEELEREKRESERRRQSELLTDIADKPKRLIPIDPIISSFDSGEDNIPGEETYIPYRPPEHPSSPDQDSDPDLREIPLTSPVRTPTPTEDPESPGSPLILHTPSSCFFGCACCWVLGCIVAFNCVGEYCESIPWNRTGSHILSL